MKDKIETSKAECRNLLLLSRFLLSAFETEWCMTKRVAGGQ
jgi:hypothetical protein